MGGQGRDVLQNRAVGCCHRGCFLLWAGRRHKERSRQGTRTMGRPSTASEAEAASSASQGRRLLASLTPGGKGRLGVAHVATEAGSRGPQGQEVAMITTESVQVPGGSGTLPESPELATFSTECSSSGPPLLGLSANAGQRSNQGAWVDAKLNPLLTLAKKAPEEAGRATARSTVAALAAVATPPTTTDNMTADTRSTADEEQAREEVYKDSLCEPMEVLRLAKEVEQEALREMEEAMQLMREVHKRRAEEMAVKNAKEEQSRGSSNQPSTPALPAETLAVPPESSPKDALGGPRSIASVSQQQETQDPGDLHLWRHVADASAARSPLQQACGKRKGHQVVSLKASVHQGHSDTSRHAYDYADILEDRKSFHRAMQAYRTPRIAEEGTDQDSDGLASYAARNRGAGHTVLLDSSQVVSGTVSCPLASLCLWTCDLCFEKEAEESGPKVSHSKPIAI